MVHYYVYLFSIDPQGITKQQGKAKQQGNIKQQSEVTWKGRQESKVVEGGSGGGKYQGPDLKISDKQFGKKVGKHAEDFGLDAKNPDSRNWVRDKINDIFKNPTQIKQGQWRGLGPIQESGNNAPGSARFFIQKNDVVVTDLDGNFVTILKDGINNGRVVDAVKIWP